MKAFLIALLFVLVSSMAFAANTGRSGTQRLPSAVSQRAGAGHGAGAAPSHRAPIRPAKPPAAK
jgi:uncharacterized protein YdeI (BOF family)